MRRGILLASLAALCLGFLALQLKYALLFASSGTIAFSRMAFAFLMLYLWKLIKTNKNKSSLAFPKLALLGAAFLGLNYLGYMKGVELTGANNTQIMIQLAPLMLILIGVFYFGEKLQKKHYIGFGLSLIGFYLFYQGRWKSSPPLLSTYAGQIWIVIGALAWAIYAAIQKKLLIGMHPTSRLNLILFAGASVFLGPTASFNEFLHLNLFQILVLVSLGLNTLVTYWALSESIRLIPAYLVSIIIVCNPVLTLILSHSLQSQSWFSPEPIDSTGYIGVLAVIMGVAISVIPGSKLRHWSRLSR